MVCACAPNRVSLSVLPHGPLTTTEAVILVGKSYVHQNKLHCLKLGFST